MSNKNLLKNMFEHKYSAAENYQVIIDKVEKKNAKKNFFHPQPLIAVLALVLVVINITFIFFGNKRIYVNNLDGMVLPKATPYGMDLWDEYDIKDDYSFVSKIKVPKYLDKKEEHIIYLNNNNTVEIHDYVITYSDNQNKRSIQLSFSKTDMDSLIDDILKDINLKTSKINGYNVVIASLEQTYYVEVEYQNLNIKIETHNIKLEELINVIKSIIK